MSYSVFFWFFKIHYLFNDIWSLIMFFSAGRPWLTTSLMLMQQSRVEMHNWVRKLKIIHQYFLYCILIFKKNCPHLKILITHMSRHIVSLHVHLFQFFIAVYFFTHGSRAMSRHMISSSFGYLSYLGLVWFGNIGAVQCIFPSTANKNQSSMTIN